jgi:hypothetical protein
MGNFHQMISLTQIRKMKMTFVITNGTPFQIMHIHGCTRNSCVGGSIYNLTGKGVACPGA